MRDRVHYREMSCNLTADEEAMFNDIGHQIGCGCEECRPDMHDAEAATAAMMEAA